MRGGRFITCIVLHFDNSCKSKHICMIIIPFSTHKTYVFQDFTDSCFVYKYNKDCCNLQSHRPDLKVYQHIYLCNPWLEVPKHIRGKQRLIDLGLVSSFSFFNRRMQHKFRLFCAASL
ncbi:hypothetical protein AQUCO_00300655v1 [Aquilegia coerulea]|uniref:Uncharacterized protein n=1 Tax=Aquilegia coerulea TaxID=218851 RepID=A0A2G5EZW8_AQUCA|nr:hypothetical protein AQUCO_00300655v1 [Aquilegia coerulea]